MLILYRIGMLLFRGTIFIASFFDKKARKFCEGRRRFFDKWMEKVKINQQNVWIHVSSLGEFEQGRPIIEKIKQEKPETSIFLTFFSPSGYEIRKNYPQADYISYLPLDSPSNARQFIKGIRPKLAIFVKYDLWYFYIKELQYRNIPVILVSGVFKKNHWMFSWKGKFFHPLLVKFNHFFVQDKSSAKSLSSLTSHITVSGDTRVDSVLQMANGQKQIPEIANFTQGKKCVVLGSTWPIDIKFMKPVIQKYRENINFIIAPHQIDEKSIEQVEMTLGNTLRFSRVSQKIKSNILIIDNIGLLSYIYRYAYIAYIGGGLHGALHNILEPAAHKVPVFIGYHKNNKKFIEVEKLKQCGGLFEMKTKWQMMQVFEELLDKDGVHKLAAQAAYQYIVTHSGATSKAMKHIAKLL